MPVAIQILHIGHVALNAHSFTAANFPDGAIQLGLTTARDDDTCAFGHKTFGCRLRLRY